MPLFSLDLLPTVVTCQPVITQEREHLVLVTQGTQGHGLSDVRLRASVPGGVTSLADDGVVGHYINHHTKLVANEPAMTPPR